MAQVSLISSRTPLDSRRGDGGMPDEEERLVAAFRAGLRLRVAASSPPAPEPKAAKPKNKKKSFVPWYVVFKTPEDWRHLLGVHHRPRASFVGRLPGQQLAGSGARDCKRFETEQKAVDYFLEKAPAGTKLIVHHD